jgi:hypothetical protein
VACKLRAKSVAACMLMLKAVRAYSLTASRAAKGTEMLYKGADAGVQIVM